MTTQAFIDLCNDPFGEAMDVRFAIVRPNSSVWSYYEMTDYYKILNVSPVTKKREKKHGVIQGQSFQVQMVKSAGFHAANIPAPFSIPDYSEAFCQLSAIFPDADEKEVVAVGYVTKVSTTTGGVITFEVHDTAASLLNYQIPRDINYQATGWISTMQVFSKDPDSKGWNSSVELVANLPADFDDETFTVTFLTATTFAVTSELSTKVKNGTISTDTDIDTSGADDALTIPAAGWNTDTWAYTAGDIFVFFSARPRTVAELTPVQMAKDLIYSFIPTVLVATEPAPLALDVFYDSAAWAAAVADTSTDEIGGFWKKGTNISAMIQDALKVVHGSIYTVASGQLAIWKLTPNTASRVVLNGDPDDGAVCIIEASTQHDYTNRVSSVTYEYLDLEGNDAAVTAVDDDTVLAIEKNETVKIGWRVRGISIESAADIHLNRVKDGRKEYTLKTTLAGMIANVGSGVTITEPELGLVVEASDVSEVTLDLLGNTAAIKAHVDPVSIGDYAIVGESLVGGSEVVW